jgi:hypothetical protein
MCPDFCRDPISAGRWVPCGLPGGKDRKEALTTTSLWSDPSCLFTNSAGACRPQSTRQPRTLHKGPVGGCLFLSYGRGRTLP